MGMTWRHTMFVSSILLYFDCELDHVQFHVKGNLKTLAYLANFKQYIIIFLWSLVENFNEIFLSEDKVNLFVKKEKILSSQMSSQFGLMTSWEKTSKREIAWKRIWIGTVIKKQRNYVTNLVNKKKRSYLSELAKRSKNKNTKPVWEALNLGHNKKKLLTLDAEILNTHFTTVASKHAEKFTPHLQLQAK